MKKRFLAVLVCVALVAALLSGTALAESTTTETLHYNSTDGKLYINGDSSRVYDGENSAWRGSGSTLTLINFSFTTSAATALKLPAGTTLALEGSNSVTSTYDGDDNTYGINCDGALTVSGGGALTATGGTSSSKSSYGVCAKGNLIMNGDGTLTGTGGTSSESSFGVYSDHAIIISGGSITGTGGTSSVNSCGVFAFQGDINASGGSIMGTGGRAIGNTNSNSYGMHAGSDITASGDCTITGTSGQVDGQYSESVGVFAMVDMTASGGSITGTAGTSTANSYGIITNALTVSNSIITGTGGQATAKSRGLSILSLNLNSGRLEGKAAAGGTPMVTFAMTFPNGCYWRTSKLDGYTTGTPPTGFQTGKTYVDMRTEPPTITFTTQPAANTTVTEGNITGGLTAVASVSPSGTATLNWYACDANGTPADTSLGTGDTFTIPTTLSQGLHYYRCQATCPGEETVYSNLATVTVNASTAYAITRGQHGEWIKGSGNALSFTANADYTKFHPGGSVSVDGTTLSAGDYTTQSGSTIVSLNASYLETLPVGRHTLRIDFTDGFAETDFFITVAGGPGAGDSPDVPKTGDSAQPALWFLIALAAGAGLAVSAAGKHRATKRG